MDCPWIQIYRYTRIMHQPTRMRGARYGTPQLILMHKSGRRARDICIARAALVMLNFELGHEEDIICAMDLREYLPATPSTSSTAIYNCNK